MRGIEGTIQIGLAVIQFITLIYLIIRVNKTNYKDVMEVYYNAKKAVDASKRAHQRIDNLEKRLNETQVNLAKVNGRTKRGDN